MYAILHVNSIQERFNNDVDDFIKTYQETDDTGLSLVIDEKKINTPSKLKNIINTIVDYIDKKLNGKNYVDEISHQPLKTQYQLWLARTYLFYQLLIFLTILVSKNTLYNKVFSDKDVFPFRKDIIPELRNFKLGIFGSITPTSDIDIGIQYSGNALVTPGLAYIVSRFECLFVLFTKKPHGSLAYDIETYADMVTLPNNETDNKLYPDFFYLDSSILTEDNFKNILVCAGKSIARSVLLSYKDTNTPINLNNITFDSIIKSRRIPSINSLICHDVLSLLKEPSWFDAAKKAVNVFLNMPYDEQRYAYYIKVDSAETLKFEKTRSGLMNLTADDICSLIILIGESLIYRMESYVCSPTVIHVVRILQASTDKKEKYKILIPKHYCNGKIQHIDPFCSIGKYGYALSALEQIGYIYRFDKQYCTQKNSDYDFAKCRKKRKKYMERYRDALFYFKKYKKRGCKTSSAIKNPKRLKTRRKI